MADILAQKALPVWQKRMIPDRYKLVKSYNGLR